MTRANRVASRILSGNSYDDRQAHNLKVRRFKSSPRNHLDLLGKARRRKTSGLRRFRRQREDSRQLAAQLDLERGVLGDETDLVDQCGRGQILANLGQELTRAKRLAEGSVTTCRAC